MFHAQLNLWYLLLSLQKEVRYTFHNNKSSSKKRRKEWEYSIWAPAQKNINGCQMEIDDDLNDDQKKALYKNDCFLFAANSIICSIIILWTWFCRKYFVKDLWMLNIYIRQLIMISRLIIRNVCITKCNSCYWIFFIKIILEGFE